MKRGKDLWWLFCINLYISAFTFGGGYVVIPMIRKYFVEKKGYFEEEELMKLAAIAQSSPGAVAINLSALSGYRAAGGAGLAVSCIAAVLPPFVILTAVSGIYDRMSGMPAVTAVLRGMESGVAALIAELVYDMYRLLLKEKNVFFSLLAPLVFFLNYVFGVNVAALMAGCILLCIAKVWFSRGKE